MTSSVVAPTEVLIGKIIGEGRQKRLDTTFPRAVAQSVIENSKPISGRIHHTCRGCKYASENYRLALNAAGLNGSMIAAGNPYHDAQALLLICTEN